MHYSLEVTIACKLSAEAGIEHDATIEVTDLTEGELQDQIDEMLATSTFPNATEWIVTGFDDADVEDLFSLYNPTVQELVDFAGAFEKHGDAATAFAMLEGIDCVTKRSVSDHLEGMYNDIEDWARAYAEDALGLSGTALRYFDAEKFARDARLEGSIEYEEIGRKVYVFRPR